MVEALLMEFLTAALVLSRFCNIWAYLASLSSWVLLMFFLSFFHLFQCHFKRCPIHTSVYPSTLDKSFVFFLASFWIKATYPPKKACLMAVSDYSYLTSAFLNKQSLLVHLKMVPLCLFH